MTAAGLIEERAETTLQGRGLLGLIGRALGPRRPAPGRPSAAAFHDCAWRLLAYAAMPITETSPEVSTLMIEGCCCCSRVRSRVLAGLWVPAASSDLVRVDGEQPAPVVSMGLAGSSCRHA